MLVVPPVLKWAVGDAGLGILPKLDKEYVKRIVHGLE
jgi:hypothetical protein